MITNSAKENIQYVIIKKIIKLLALFPRKSLTHLAKPIAEIWFKLDCNHRNIAINNIQNAFGVDKIKSYKMAKANFVHIARAVLGMPYLFKLNSKNINSYVVFSGQENLKKAISSNKGILFFSAHLGNWELMSLATSIKFGIQINLLVRELDYSPMEKIITEVRIRTGNTVINKLKSAKIISRLLRENKIVAIMLDQSASWREGVYIPFFNRIACTNKGLALFASKYDATVIPVFNIRQQDGRYKIIFEPPVALIQSGDISGDIVKNTTRFNMIIEKYVRMAPDNWFWVHRRWKMKNIPEKISQKLKHNFQL